MLNDFWDTINEKTPEDFKLLHSSAVKWLEEELVGTGYVLLRDVDETDESCTKGKNDAVLPFVIRCSEGNALHSLYKDIVVYIVAGVEAHASLMDKYRETLLHKGIERVLVIYIMDKMVRLVHSSGTDEKWFRPGEVLTKEHLGFDLSNDTLFDYTYEMREAYKRCSKEWKDNIFLAYREVTLDSFKDYVRNSVKGEVFRSLGKPSDYEDIRTNINVALRGQRLEVLGQVSLIDGGLFITPSLLVTHAPNQACAIEIVDMVNHNLIEDYILKRCVVYATMGVFNVLFVESGAMRITQYDNLTGISKVHSLGDSVVIFPGYSMAVGDVFNCEYPLTVKPMKLV